MNIDDVTHEVEELSYEEFEFFRWLIDPTDRNFANNAPLYDFKCVNCGLYCESHVNEAQIWSCPRCGRFAVDSGPVPLRKTFRTSPSIPRVWHGHLNMTTGQWVSDRKQFREQLHVAGEESTEREGYQQNFIEVDPSDRDALGLTDEGLDSTHDRHVQLGWKESKGRFVFPMSQGPSK